MAKKPEAEKFKVISSVTYEFEASLDYMKACPKFKKTPEADIMMVTHSLSVHSTLSPPAFHFPKVS